MYFIKKAIVFVLTLESRLILRKYRPFIVAVTGSVGKTSTKDAIYDVLCAPGTCKADGTGMCHVRKSEKSMNSEIGLPLTVIGVPNAWYSVSGWVSNMFAGLGLIFGSKSKIGYPDCLVLELGADHPGDIKKVAKWLRPDIAVITKISRTPVHVEFFSSPQEVFEEKASLALAIKPGGALVIFGDDDNTAELGERIGKEKSVRVLTFGIEKPATVRALDIKPLMEGNLPKGITFTLDVTGETRPVALNGILGKGHIYSVLAAAAVGKARGLGIGEIATAASSYNAPKGRMNILNGINGSVIIDDTYNSSPDAGAAALEALSVAGGERKIAVMGDMMELGKYAGDEHRIIGKTASDVLGAQGLLVTVGQRSRVTKEEAVRCGIKEENARAFDSSLEAAEYLKPLIMPGDVILIKGSQAVRMERTVSALLQNPEKASELLVRQEKEWLEKK